MSNLGTNVGAIYYDCTLDTQKLVQQSRTVERTLADVAGGFNVVAKAAQALAVVLGAIKLAEVADEFRQLETRVKVAAGSVDAGTVAFDRLFQMSQRTQTALAGNVEVFTRLNQSILQMGGTQDDTLRMTELLGKAIKVSGVSAGEAKAAMLQFGQALGSGKLQGDELRSLMETAPYLMRQLADSIGVPVGQLKSLGEQGKLTADVVANALNKAANKITEDFEKFPPSFTDAFQAMREQAAMTVVKMDDLTGSSAALTGATQGLGEVLDRLAAQFGAANEKAGDLGRDDTVKTWAKETKVALSYVVDAADVAWQALSVLGRNVAFVFTGVKNEVVGIGQQIAAVARGDFAGAAAIGEAMKADGERRRAELDAADAKTLAKRKLFGEQMREAWEQGAGGGRGVVNPEAAPSALKSPKDPEEVRKAAAKTAAAQAYYQALVASNKTALEQIDAEEQRALTENRRRMIEDKDNAGIYQKARAEIVKRFARERALLEEQTQQEIADLQIELTTDAEAKIEAIRVESIRRAGAAAALGTMTHDQAERAKTAATTRAERDRAVLAEQLAQTVAETRIEATMDELTRIDLARQESFRRADAAAKAGAITYAQAEADKARAAVQAQQAIRQQLLSINPLAALEQEYQQKLSIVQRYEQAMAQAGVDGAEFVAAKRAELDRSYQLQRQQLAEAEFAGQSAANAALINGVNSLGQTATGVITGLIGHTMTAQDAMRALAGVVLNEAVGALVQIGLQYIKNAIMGVAAEKAVAAAKGANAIAYAAAVKAQVGVQTSLAAQAAFASTAAIPIIGPALAPEAATAAGIAAAALGAPAIIAAPVAGARRYGGPTSAGGLYRVNESGIEMWTASNGSQYMLAGSNGRVTPADQVNSGANVTLQVTVENNHPSAGVSVQQSDDGKARIIINEVASQISDRRGPVWSALRTTNVQGRPG